MTFHQAMIAQGWQPAITLWGKVPYWQHRNGARLVFWRDWQREYAVSGATPPPF